MAVQGVTTDAYTWDTAAKDLALLSRLTLQEAGDLTGPLRDSGMSPDALLPSLVRLVDALGPSGSYVSAGTALYRLATGREVAAVDARNRPAQP